MSFMKPVNDMVVMTVQEREHWQRVGLLHVFGGSIFIRLSVGALVKLIF
jgi:hypothetical protein